MIQQYNQKLGKVLVQVAKNTFAGSNKYAEDYQMSQNEINSILGKVEKKPDIMMKHEFKYNYNFDMDIKEQLSEIQKNAQQMQTIQPIEEQEDQKKQENTQLEEQNKEKQSTEIEVKYYKYGLPIPNIEPELTPLPDPFERPEDEMETINERVMSLLRINENTSYQQFELALQQEFNNEVDMYGDSIDNQNELMTQIVNTEKDQCIPRDVLVNQEYMDQIRRNITLNLNMPGVMENEHPHKFLKNLRPVEEFRHTPIIPISDRQMNEFNERVKAYHRRGFYFEIKKEAVYNYTFLGICCIIGVNLVLKAIQREEETGVSVERLKLQRIQNNQVV